jgi:hypothetical protein
MRTDRTPSKATITNKPRPAGYFPPVPICLFSAYHIQTNRNLFRQKDPTNLRFKLNVEITTNLLVKYNGGLRSVSSINFPQKYPD